MLDRWRGWTPSRTAVRRAFLAALVANVGIVVTGGAVRLTASGLGCPTFPRCTDSSLVVTREMGAHGLVEFGNRMLTFALTAAVAVAVVTAWRARRPDLLRPAGLMVLGIVVQALLGGVTVLTGLNPVTVMAHFLLSMLLVAVAVLAHDRAGRGPADAVRRSADVRRELLLGSRALVGVTALTLVLGTVVTGTGPHSGDKNATHRLPFDLREVTQLHADAVFLLVGLAIGLAVAMRVADAPEEARRRSVQLLAVLVAQAAIGYLQYATNLPIGLVAAHLLGASLVWVAVLRLHLATATRPLAAAAEARRDALVVS
jgi:cytochrome c oxidase assembly protein subunit 15